MTVFQALLIALSLLHVRAYVLFTIEDPKHKHNVTEDWKIVRHIHMSHPLVVKVKDSLVHILDSKDNMDHAIQFESEDFDTCRVPLNLAHPMRYPRRATSLGNGKVVVWLLNYRLTAYKHVAEWRFVVVEPWSCTYRKFEIADVDPFPVDVVDVIGYEDTLDVLIRPLRNDESNNTYVYRYNENGEPVSSVIGSVIPDTDSYPFYQPDTIRLYPLKEHDRTEGFFYVQVKPETNTTALKRLNSNFEVMFNTTLQHSTFRGFGTDDYSVSHHGFTTCHSREENNFRFLHCILLNDKLKQKTNVTLSHDNYSDFFENIAHLVTKNLSGNEGVLLTFAVRINHQPKTPIYVQKINNDGRVSEPKQIGKVYCEIYDLKTFEMSDDTYCIAISCVETLHTRCINLKDYS
ncbi:uncharacterized protein LOC107980538 [Nasonia vitripennis]|uniref:Uncharacterized protein n=1 Tax=Nasonia vitripennis TaxID=7425 RepID=A0A7M7M1K7_NASVI|nr:uncharacterized protein LOC107980538 [Nasonia vitripennis]